MADSLSLSLRVLSCARYKRYVTCRHITDGGANVIVLLESLSTGYPGMCLRNSRVRGHGSQPLRFLRRAVAWRRASHTGGSGPWAAATRRWWRASTELGAGGEGQSSEAHLPCSTWSRTRPGSTRRDFSRVLATVCLDSWHQQSAARVLPFHVDSRALAGATLGPNLS